MPILQKVLARRDACSVALRRKAVFLVSQKRLARLRTSSWVSRATPGHSRCSGSVRRRTIPWPARARSVRGAADEEV